MFRYFDLIGIVVLVLGLPVPLSGAEARSPVPAAPQQAEARKTIREAYKAQYANPKQSEQLALAADLLEQAGPTLDDVAKYVMLCEARDLAARSADLALAGRACEQLAIDFDVTLGAARLAMFEAATGAVTGEDDNAVYIVDVLQAVDDALREDDFAAAEAMLHLAEGTLPRARNSKLTDLVFLRRQDIERQTKEYATVKPVLGALQQKPDDATANTLAGKYTCFIKGDWGQGLAMLAKGDDAKLKQQAQADLADPAQPDAQVVIGDGWYGLGSGQIPGAWRIEMRAYEWYAKAAPFLSGLAAKRVEGRLAELGPVVSKRWDWGEVWVRVRAALRQKTYDVSKIAGGGFGKVSFEEIPPAGGILIGLRYAVGTFVNSDMIEFVQGIYLMPRGEVLGEPHGQASGRIQTVKARSGYAVGALITRSQSGAFIDGMNLKFMKIAGKALNPNEAYTSAVMANREGREEILGGDGTPIIGITGRTQSNGKLSGISIVLMAPATDDGKKPPRAGNKPPRPANPRPPADAKPAAWWK